MRIEPFPGDLVMRPCKNGGKMYVLTDEQESWLRRWFPVVENARICEASGLKDATLHRIVRELGLCKSEKGLRAIRRRQARKAVRACRKNGYYESMKGRKPSEASRRATAQMWKDVREGRRESPVSVMRRENPRKYKKWMERKSKERRESIRKEKLRVLYGLERKTRLVSVVMCCYTRSQIDHRFSALRRGYILMEDCSEQGGERYNIYWDGDTERSERFERNLVNDGFRLMEYDGR